MGNRFPELLHQFFEVSARHWPERTAVEVPGRCVVTYAELERRANDVAAALRGVVPTDAIAAILLPRDERLYAAQLGILKAGAAYACIDRSFPDTRVREILDDATLLLTDAAGAARARSIGFAGRIVEEFPAAAFHAPTVQPHSLAYVIYTSGTTGRPKGVMIEHASIANLVASDLLEFGLTPEARVAQNSSAAYDSSVEETWLAFAAGATLVVMDDDTARLGPDLIPWLRHHRVTVLCPTPTMLRATGCDRPDIDLPDLTLLYTGGEALPQDLADRWSKRSRLCNGYGPTECSVTCTRGDVEPGGPVSIGKPVANMQAWVLNEALDPVPDGEWGELYMSGVGLARGYRNRPEQTTDKFVQHPMIGRIYRTGDLVSREPGGNLFYHGRADTQVKIRGYRIELEEIEARLAELHGVRAAACTVQDGALSAFVVPENGSFAHGAEMLADRLRETLPEYMVPVRFGVLRELPLTTGGKLNRNALPKLKGHARRRGGPAPRNARERDLAATFQEILGLDHEVASDADFFTELGGNSLRAAQLVTRLREQDASTPVTVRDVYECRTVERLAERTAPVNIAAPTSKSFQRRVSSVPATILQTIWLAGWFSIAALVSYAGLFVVAPWLTIRLGLGLMLLLAPVMFFVIMALYTPVSLLAAVAVKQCLIGRYRPMRAPVWGSFYVRNWLVQQVVRAVPWWLIEGTGFQNMGLRWLGARIGKRVHIHRGVDLLHGGWDLLDLGDDVMIGQEAMLGLVELEDGEIVIRPVTLGDGCTLETRAGVSGDARMDAGAYLTALSWLPPGQRIPTGERWDGIPAQSAGFAPAPPDVDSGIAPLLHGLLMVLARGVFGQIPAFTPLLLASMVVTFLGLDGNRLAGWISDPALSPEVVAVALGLFTLAAPVTVVLELILMRILGRVRDGVMGRWSLSYIRVRMRAEILEAAGGWLAGSLLWPVWLRAVGMKLAKGCEISTILDTIPEMVEMGAGTFLADGIYIGGPRLHRGTVTMEKTRIGARVFLGNHVVIPGGRTLPDDVLLGVCTVAGEQMEGGRSWFGLPPFELPRREVVQCDESWTVRPPLSRRLVRLFWEMLRCVLPVPRLLAGLGWLYAVDAAADATRWWVLPLTVCAAGMVAETLLCLLAVGVKWLLLGRVKPGQHAFWASWCGRWDFVYVGWESWARAGIAHLEGTVLLTWYLRAMGAKLGKRVVLGPGFSQVVDPDMLLIEDDATVNAMFQAHTFEDRVLKMDYVRVRRGATLGSACVPLYGADIGESAYVAPHSVIMKDERLLAGVSYEGAPTRPKATVEEVAVSI